MFSKVLLCLFLSLLLPSMWARYTRGVVNELTSSNITSEVLNDKSYWLVEFYAPWCFYCKKMLPELEKLATITDGKFKVGKADADIDEDLFIYVKDGYPAIVIFGRYTRTAYRGKRTAIAMKNAILYYIRNRY